jgi:hypothetical protein
MGAWGTGPFQNDTAGDFVDVVTDGDGLVAIEDAFDHVLEADDDDLEAPTAEEAIAGAAIVARLKTGVSLAGEEAIEAWVAKDQPQVSPDLIAKAWQAVARIMTEPSELLDLWRESDDFAGFRASIDGLLRSLG